MDNSLLSKIHKEFDFLGYPLSSRDAKKWLRLKLKELRFSPRTLMGDLERHRKNSLIGKMYFFFYDPKTKEELPFYDKFPLVIPLEKYGDGFLGLNLHYVPPAMRFVIIERLSKKLNNQKMDETTRMRVSYDYLSSLKNFSLFQPCIKRYLYSHIRSRFLFIEPNEWYFSCLLPFEMFRKQSKKKIYSQIGTPVGTTLG